MKYLNSDYKLFSNTFEILARKHGYFYIWEDFLDLFINGFSFNHKIDLSHIQSKYTKEERLKFGLLIKEVILLLDKKITSDNSWYDFFGSFYEEVSLSKQQGFAQFFTPGTVCNFMAQILSPQKNENFSDPCCGSGRFSLASNSVNLGMFHFLVDIDYTCTKMSSLNLMMHGIRGVVICDDGLFPNKSFKGAFLINRNLAYTKIPEIEFVSNVNEAYNYVRTQIFTKEDFINENKIEEIKKEDDFKDVQEFVSKNGQLQLF